VNCGAYAYKFEIYVHTKKRIRQRKIKTNTEKNQEKKVRTKTTIDRKTYVFPSSFSVHIFLPKITNITEQKLGNENA